MALDTGVVRAAFPALVRSENDATPLDADRKAVAHNDFGETYP